MSYLLRTKSIDALIAASEEPSKQLRRTLGPIGLIALGIGAVIGSGIFVLSGTAAAGTTLKVSSVLKATMIDLVLNGSTAASSLGRPGAGPGIALSFILAGIACGFAALCYAELASMIPIAGSAYTYSYATLGEIFAWIIGWDLILEYAVSNMMVAVGFSGYFNKGLKYLFNVELPPQWSTAMFDANGPTGSYYNFPALLIVMLITVLLVRGVKEGAGANAVMVLIKLAAILIFITGAAGAINTANWHPFFPNGYPGVLTGASIVFFTYIGFDSVSTAAEECRKPQRDMPVGIIGTLIICTVLYVAVSLVLTGIGNYKTLANDAPVANALEALHLDKINVWVTWGGLFGMVSSILVYQYGQARIWFAMSRDGLLPKMFAKVHPVHQTPHVSTWIAGLVVGVPAGIGDINVFADLASIGTLFAFVLVSAGVIVLRRKQPERKRGFRVPLVPLVPVLSIVCCGILMLGLPLETWIRFFVWLAIGLVIYFAFSRKSSVLAEQA